MTHRTTHLVIYCTAVALAASVFMPLARLPLMGQISYHAIAEIEAWILVAIAASAPALILAGKEKLCILPAMVAWVTLLWPAIENQVMPEETNLLNQALGQSQRIMQEYAIDLFTHITEFSWGGLLMIGSLTVLTLASLYRLFK